MKKLLIMITIIMAANPVLASELYNTNIKCNGKTYYCLKTDKILIRNELIKCTKTVGFVPNGGEYEDWDTSDYPRNLRACSQVVAQAFGCECEW